MCCREHAVLRHNAPIAKYYDLHFEKELGQGGIGRVSQATCLRTGRKRAIKIVHKKFNPKCEVSVLKPLDHPSICRIFEHFEEQSSDKVYLCLELCRGGELAEYATAFFPPLGEKGAAVIIWQLLGAVRYLHKQSLSHGDICPRNILMLSYDQPPERNVAKLCDFGAQVGTRTHDLPSLGLVMSGLLTWCHAQESKGHDVLGGKTDEVNKNAKIAVSSDGRILRISRAAADLRDRLSSWEQHKNFTAGVALRHRWFLRARKGTLASGQYTEVPRRIAAAREPGHIVDTDGDPRGQRNNKSLKKSNSNRSLASNGSRGRSSSNGRGRRDGSRGRNITGNHRDHSSSRSCLSRRCPSVGQQGRHATSVDSFSDVSPAGFWGACGQLRADFLSRLRNFASLNILAKAALLVAADLLEEKELIPLRAAFLRMDGWCPDGLITSRKLRKHLPRMGCTEIPPDLEILMIEADVDGVGALDYTTFVAVCLDPDYVLSTKLGHDVFALLDRDQDGLLSAADVFPLLRAAKTLGFHSEHHPKGALDFHGFSDLLLRGMCEDEGHESLPSRVSRTIACHRLSDLARERQRFAVEAMQDGAYPERLRTIKAKTFAAAKQTVERTKDVSSKKSNKKNDTKRAKQIKGAQTCQTPTLIGCLDSDDVANLDDLMDCSQHGSGSEIDDISDDDVDDDGDYVVVSLDGSDANNEKDPRRYERSVVSL
eukprot:TRINITY_DN56825_c0_g1_i1.p1 TRINITY_DN56825_c0_g1~~TRINITY_DN56825_c0_g1_i1.p1  ORF type:complete len:711 (+),score=94.19 TRINITY_DN56825_c0_g1_i1:196-2328(+)